MIGAFEIFDKLFFGRLIPAPTAEESRIMIDGSHKMSDDDIYRMIDDATGDIDSKTAALLTHISIIVAALTFLYTLQTGLFRFVFILELCMYLSISILCLRAINFTWTYKRGDVDEAERNITFATELNKRGQLYNLAANSTVYITIAMMITLLIDGIIQMTNV